MSIERELFNEDRNVPQDDEEDWGVEVTTELSDLLEGLNFSHVKVSGNILQREQSASNTLAALATLTQTAPVHLIQGSGGAVSLNATTAIADGSFDGQLLTLVGAHASNFVTVPAAANTSLRGPCTLELGDVLRLRWSSGNSAWEELSRNN